MIRFHKSLIASAALIASGLISIAVGCAKDDEPQEGATPAVPTNQGATCDAPLSITGRVSFSGFPQGREVIAVSGLPNDELKEGGLALIAEGSYGHALAMMVDGKPVRIPDSAGAMQMIGATLPTPGGEQTRLLVFSRASIKPVARYANRDVYDVDPKSWTLELRVLSARGDVIASSSLPQVDESVLPFDIDVKGPPNTASILIQHDKRPVPGRRIRERNPSPLSMQILHVTLEGSALKIVEEEREPFTEDDMRDLATQYIPEPAYPTTSCGPVLDVFGLGGEFLNSGTCDPGSFCKNHECVAADAGTSACVPKSQAELCGQGGCGKRYDGCEAIIDCPACPEGQACGAETTGKCSDPNALTPSDVRAVFGGAKVCGCFTDGAKTTPVACDAKEKCQDGMCVPQ